tara:strand:- start:7962 stop:8702 length:741 start_codon:yes stop_codon:yes gene_type:complete
MIIEGDINTFNTMELKYNLVALLNNTISINNIVITVSSGSIIANIEIITNNIIATTTAKTLNEIDIDNLSNILNVTVLSLTEASVIENYLILPENHVSALTKNILSKDNMNLIIIIISILILIMILIIFYCLYRKKNNKKNIDKKNNVKPIDIFSENWNDVRKWQINEFNTQLSNKNRNEFVEINHKDFNPHRLPSPSEDIIHKLKRKQHVHPTKLPCPRISAIQNYQFPSSRNDVNNFKKYSITI